MVDDLVARVGISTGFVGVSFRDASMRALWSDRLNCSRNESQTFKLISRFSDVFFVPDSGCGFGDFYAQNGEKCDFRDFSVARVCATWTANPSIFARDTLKNIARPEAQ